MDSLWCALEDEVNIVVEALLEGRWRHPKITNYQKRLFIVGILYFFPPKQGKKTVIVIQKWLYLM